VNVIVCIKQVPEVADAELELDEQSGDVDRDDLVLGINEWDNYAVEAAVRLKEQLGGKVTAITIGDEDAEDELRRALAMGADAAVLVDVEDFEGADAVGIARGLAGAIAELEDGYDLVLTGAQSADDGWGQVGGALAELLGLPYATLAVAIEPGADTVVVRRELEANTHERVELGLPALVTVQTGINEPRYVSIMGIRKARSIEITELDADDLELGVEQIGAAASAVAEQRLTLPGRGEGAEILTGSLEGICDRVAAILRERGGLA
jgi:electron transfer flavoprotein beta subunit